MVALVKINAPVMIVAPSGARMTNSTTLAAVATKAASANLR